MQLVRYYQWCIKTITANNYEYIVKFSGTKNIPGKIIFTSPQVIVSAVLASQYLSLTYLPRHRYDFDSKNFKLFDNEGNVINSHNPDAFLRTWPAFGKYGGGIEVLVELDDFVVTPSSDDILLDGGEFDRFHQDSILPMTKQILQLIANRAIDIFKSETGVGLVKNGSPVFKWQKNQENFTISVGIKETPDGMILHIWGTKWKDFDSFRCIFCLLEDEFQAKWIGRSELEEIFKNKNGPYFSAFSDKIKDIIIGLQKCTEPEYPYRRCPLSPECIVRLP
jgi:hypothetical protein